MYRIFVAMLFILTAVTAHSQIVTSQQDIMDEILTNSAESDNASHFEAAKLSSEYLEGIVNNKIDINSDDISDLQSIPFVSGQQILQIENYIKRYGALESIGELKSLPAFKRGRTLEYLPYFVYAGHEGDTASYTLRDMLSKGTHSLAVASKCVLERQQAYEVDSNGETVYDGGRMMICTKYRYYFKNRVAWGVSCKKDAGESFGFDDYKYGFDYNSIFFRLEDFGNLKRLILGDYSVKFGQGLVLGGGFSGGKAVTNTGTQIREYGSFSEHQFYRGMAGTFTIGNLQLSGIVSHDLYDATCNDINSFSNFKTDGYHRNSKEMRTKDNLQEDHLAFIIHGGRNRFSIEGLIHYFHFDKTFIPSEIIKNAPLDTMRYGLEGSVGYSYSSARVNIYGESAIDSHYNFATINTFEFVPTDFLKLTILQRYYDKGYQALRSTSIGQNTRVCNEEGIYFGTIISPARWLDINIWCDFFRFPWLTTYTKTPTSGVECVAQVSMRLNRKIRFLAKVKHKEREQSEIVEDVDENSYVKLTWEYTPFNGMKLNSTGQWSHYSDLDKTERGYLVYQNIQWNTPKKTLYLAARFALFSAPYNARIYSFENDITNFFSVPGYYNNGARYYIVVSSKIAGRFVLQTRLSQWKYFDRQSISSGNSEIQGTHKTEINFCVKISL